MDQPTWGEWQLHVEKGGAYYFRLSSDGKEQRHVIWRAGEVHNEPLPA